MSDNADANILYGPEDWAHQYEPEDYCPTCGGEGTAEYQDCPEAWGEDGSH